MAMEQVLGMLFGLALGDALGAPVEFLSVSEIKQKYPPTGIRELPEPARVTDDTLMTLAVAEALIAAGHQDLETFMAAVTREFVAWLRSPDNVRAPGQACLYGVQQLEKGLSWRESGKPGAKGSGAAMRVAPIGYFYQHDLPRLRERARATALATHRHPVAEVAAVAAAFLVKVALDHPAPKDFLPALKAEVQGQAEDFDAALKRLEKALTMISPEAGLAYIGDGWVAEEAVLAALYCFLIYPYEFKAAIRLAANSGGDSDTIACLTGGISGAYLGISHLPGDWVKRVEKSAYLEDVARRLVAARG
jgi:ADP-ribosylglycohydrolase